MQLDSTYWNDRYLNDDFVWDLGAVSPPIKAYVDQLTNKSLSILVPGAGNAHEAGYLFSLGFNNVNVLDFAEEPLNAFRKQHPSFPSQQLHKTDFFEHKGQYDLIIEQTFFCALNPSLRRQYAIHMHSLLKPKGKLAGVLFNDVLNTDKPPFGGNSEEYKVYFEPYFTIKILEPCYNSVKPRADRELFMILEKK